MASEDAVTKHKLAPLARIVGYSVVGVESHIMGNGQVRSQAARRPFNVFLSYLSPSRHRPGPGDQTVMRKGERSRAADSYGRLLSHDLF